MDSNHRPHAYQACALATWATNRFLFCFAPLLLGSLSIHSVRALKSQLIAVLPRVLGTGTAGWWRWWGSNPWPPACRAGALPAELHPRFRVVSTFSKIISDLQKLNNKSSVLAICANGSSSTPTDPWKSVMVSIERRWSSRTFRYGYLVTT